MAERRMISKKIVDTDSFMDMPMSTRLLYYELNWRADDDGFVASPKKIIKLSGCSDDDIKLLFMKNFVIPFDSGIILITDWRIHNSIQKDRYHETQYLDEKSQVSIAPNGSYVSPVDRKCIQDVSKMETEARLGKASLGKARIGESKQPLFEQFWSAYPKKQNKSYSQQVFNKIKQSEIEHIMYSLERFKETREWMENDGKFIPMASTWLNQQRWLDFDMPEAQNEEYIPPDIEPEPERIPMTPEAERMIAEALKGNTAYDYTTGKA